MYKEKPKDLPTVLGWAVVCAAVCANVYLAAEVALHYYGH